MEPITGCDKCVCSMLHVCVCVCMCYPVAQMEKGHRLSGSVLFVPASTLKSLKACVCVP